MTAHYLTVAAFGAILLLAPFAAYLTNSSETRPMATFYSAMGN